ncbi:MAG: MarR family transcriptional regulator [Armatimonadetes bacterium]|nr:MarR family transcriptional regulator [Armatimonadota bacterium]
MSDIACLGDLLRVADLFSHIVSRTLNERLVAEISDDHVSVAQLGAVRFIRLHRRVRMGDLANGLMITYPSATNMVNRLERQGLATRGVNPSDHREVEVSLTPEGMALADRIDEERASRLETMLGSMPERARESLSDGLYSFVSAAVGGSLALAEDICLRCGTRAGSGCPVASLNPEAPCR